jgi:hypothetical protein
MKRKLVFWTAFNSYQSAKLLRKLPPNSNHPVSTTGWLTNRVDLFKKFNLPSILQQTYDDFLYIVLLDPNFKKQTEALLPKTDGRILYVYEDAEALSIIKQYDEIVYALIDSDDMYSKTAGEIMMNPDNKEWMYFKYGFSYDYKGKHIWKYDTIGSGPFFAHRFDPINMKQFDREKRHPTHKAVINLNPQELEAGNFCVLLHNTNTSSHINMRYILKDQPINMKSVRRQFGNLLG